MEDAVDHKLTPEQMARVLVMKQKILQALGGPYEIERDPLASLLAVLDAAAAICTYPWQGRPGFPMSAELFSENARQAHRARSWPDPSRQS